MSTFSHSGDLGDIIASLPAVRTLGGGRLIIFDRPGGARESMKGKRFEAIRPLLLAQPYIASVEWSDVDPRADYDFSTFRHDHIFGESLAHWQARHVGVEIDTAPWLTVPNPNHELRDRILVARTARYQNWKFPWQKIVADYRDRLLFIGMPDEHKAFCRLLGNVEYLPTRDMLAVAEAIAGSRMLIANQTASCWIGIGLGHPLVQEQSPVTHDSVIQRENAQFIQFDNMPVMPNFNANLIASEVRQAKVASTVTSTVVFPFHSGDQPQAKALAELIRDLGGVEDFQCLLLYPQGTNTEGVEEPLREAFGSVETHTYQATLSGWPQGPNEMFAEAAQLIARDPRFHDFLWLEPDCVLTSPTSIAQLFAAYRASGQPLLGVTVDTVAIDSKQVVGRHVVGVAIYPKNFAQLCPLVRFLKSMSSEHVRARAVPMAFDAYFGAYTKDRCAQTRLIQHFWRSEWFHEQGGAIVAGKTVPPGVENVVRPEAVLLHGCKDDSLLQIIRRKSPIASRTVRHTPTHTIITHHNVASIPVHDGPTVMDTQLANQSKDVSVEGVTGSVSNGAASTLPAPKPQKGKLPIIPPEQWIRGEDGLPIPPFMKGQPEWERQRELTIARLQQGGFAKLRDYARKNLKINTLRMTAEKIIEAVVLAERKAGKMPWTKNVAPAVPPKPPAQEIPPQVNPMPQWGPEKPQEGATQISDTMRAKMLQMRKERGLVTT